MKTLPVSSNVIKFSNSFRANEDESKKSTVVAYELADKATDDKKKRTTTMVTAAVAVASLGLASYAALKKPKRIVEVEQKEATLKAEIEKLTALINNSSTDKEVQNLKENISQLETSISDLEKGLNSIQKNKENVKNIKSLQQQLDSLKQLYSSLKSIVATPNVTHVNNTAGGTLYSREVVLNGKSFALADVELNKVSGDVAANLQKTLRTEATRRMLGLSKGLPKIPENGWIRVVTSEYKGIAKTGGLGMVPPEQVENLAIMTAGVQKMNFAVDMPLYRGHVEKSAIKDIETNLFNTLEKNADGTFDYVQTAQKSTGETSRKTIMKGLRKVDTMSFDLYGDKSVKRESVDVLMGEYLKKFDYESKKDLFNPEVKDAIEKMENNSTYEWGSLVVKKDAEGKIDTYAKINHIFYDNGESGKFHLNVADNYALNIYNNEALSAGEAERFIFFDRCVVEELRGQQEHNLPGASAIIGNDWHAGGVAASLRLLIPVQKAYGEITPRLADELYNIPFIGIEHNAALSGDTWHSQPKLINMLFGKHSAMIAENAYMPNLKIEGKYGGLDLSTMGNGLMDGQNLNPLTMLTAYSDYIVPVSEGYAGEIASSNVFGYNRRPLFELRARKGVWSDLNNLKFVANQTGIAPDEVSKIDPTLLGITNGCDRANNTFNAKCAENLEKIFNLPKGMFKQYEKDSDALMWHNHNKKNGLNFIKEQIDLARRTAGKENPMQLEMPDLTDLTGVTEDTPVFVSAGRIVGQKGLDILAKSIEEFYKNFKGKDYPVFYVQGIGDAQYKEYILAAKREVAKTNPDAAKRIVFANLFSEPGRYDLSKIIADYTLMPSWFEPCGLSHKEIGQFSGAGSVVTRTGGLRDGLTEGLNMFSSELKSDKGAYENGVEFAKALNEAVELHSDKSKYKKLVKSMMETNFDWRREGGPIYQYTSLLEKMNVLTSEAANVKV